MALSITTSGEIGINGYKYNLDGPINQRIIQKSVSKVNTGSDSYDKEAVLSNWIASDHRDGIGIDEMDESIHANRSWCTNCNVSYDGHCYLPRLATAISTFNGLTGGWNSPTGNTANGWANPTTAYDENEGGGASYSIGASQWSPYLELTRAEVYCNRIRILPSRNNTNITTMAVDAYYDGAYVNIYSATPTYEAWNTINLASTKMVTGARIRFLETGGVGATAYVYEFDFGEDGTAPSGALTCAANFNGNLYWACANWLVKMNAGRTAFTAVKAFGTTITALIPSLNSRLYVYLGDSTNYYYMSTAEVFTQSNSANAYWGIQWGDLLWKLNTSGIFSSSSDPDGAGPTWANEGDITDIASQIATLFTGPDASGNNQIYCATKSILKIYNDTTNKWLDTEVKLPTHPNGGKGAAYWNSSIFLSYGLGVKKYVPGSTASLSEIGLDRDGGLPSEYNGEIVKFCADSQFVMFALVDASQATGTSQSGLYAWDDRGWQCYWADSNNDVAMYDVIVSSASSAYAVYFACGSSIIYIDLPRGIGNPKYYSPSYATSGIFISPWFDAGTPALEKMIKRLRSYAKGITTTETVTIKYRTNKTYTDRDTGWTSLEILNTTGENGENLETFASGVGEEFNCIQYRLDFARGATATLSPDILSMVLSYKLQTASTNLKAWDFTVNIDGELDTASEKQQYEHLLTALATDTLIALNIFGDDTAEPHYIMLFLNGSQMYSGRDYAGKMALTAIEV